jgi:hypothetical protein
LSNWTCGAERDCARSKSEQWKGICLGIQISISVLYILLISCRLNSSKFQDIKRIARNQFKTNSQDLKA